MAIDLNTLNISLDKFNDVSGGTYNIGHLKLGEDGTSVYRVNNRKTLTFLNRTEIKPEEALAVKIAFCNALEKEGCLTAGNISSVKARLGIPQAGVNTFKALKAGSIIPLTAADVREVIDEYAGLINRKRESKGVTVLLRTSSDIYQGVSSEILKSRAATRDKINGRTFEKTKTPMANNTVNSLLDLLENSSQGESGPTLDKKDIAREIITKLNNDVLKETGESMSVESLGGLTLLRSEGGKISAKITLDDGKTMTLDTGLTRDGLYAKMTHIAVNSLLELLKYSRKGGSRPTQDQKAVASEILFKLNYGAFTKKGAFAGESMSVSSLKGLTLSLNADSKISVTIALDDKKTKTETLDTGLTRIELYDKMADIVLPPNPESTQAAKTKPAKETRPAESKLTDSQMLLDLQQRLPGIEDGNEIYDAVETAFKKLKNGDDKEMLYNLTKHYSLVKNENMFKSYIEKQVQEEKTTPKYQKAKRRIVNNREIMDKTAEIAGLDDQVLKAIRSSVRSDQVEMALGPLLISLGNARGQDDRNYELMREVREAFDPPKEENAGVNGNKKFTELIKDITLALTEQRPSFDDKIKMYNEKIQMIKSAKSENAKSEDDLEENLNIDAWLNSKQGD